MISFACKQAMVQLLRPHQRCKKSYTPTRSCASGGGEELEDEEDEKSTPVPPLNVTPPSDNKNQGASELQPNGGEPYQILVQ